MRQFAAVVVCSVTLGSVYACGPIEGRPVEFRRIELDGDYWSKKDADGERAAVVDEPDELEAHIGSNERNPWAGVDWEREVGVVFLWTGTTCTRSGNSLMVQKIRRGLNATLRVDGSPLCGTLRTGTMYYGKHYALVVVDHGYAEWEAVAAR